jgi:hypothetical protein
MTIWDEALREKCLKEQSLEFWHDNYEDKTSTPYKRTLIVKKLIVDYLINKNNITILSICAGQGRDVLTSLNADTYAYLIDIDKKCIDYAQSYVNNNNIHNVSIIKADASLISTYVDNNIPKADLILICGVFGHLSLEDISITAQSLKQLIKTGGSVIWTRHKFDNDITKEVREAFELAGYKEETFISPKEEPFSIGMHKLIENAIEPIYDLKMFDYIEFN